MCSRPISSRFTFILLSLLEPMDVEEGESMYGAEVFRFKSIKKKGQMAVKGKFTFHCLLLLLTCLFK